MQVFESLDAVPADFGPSAVTIGKFDGVHAGHRQVIGTLLEVAAERRLTPTVLTFDRNPLSLLRPEACPEALVSNRQKLEKLEQAGVGATLMVAFDRAFSELSPENFVQHVLVDALHARVVLVGPDFRFGAKGAGTVPVLAELGAANGFDVVAIEGLRLGGERRASSTWVRELLSEGRVREAAAVLGDLPTIRSVVVHGEQRGRAMGYPTANLSPELEGYIPADGVYAAWLVVDGIRYPAAVSIGNNPTFDGVPDKQVEAHALDQKLDLYDKTVEVAFVDYIRPMNRFDGMESLVKQMNHDELRIREVLASS